MKVKLVPVGNSKGVRIPQAFIRACGFQDHVDMRMEQGAIVLTAFHGSRQNWDAAFKKMAVMGDDTLFVPDDAMSDWDDTEWEW